MENKKFGKEKSLIQEFPKLQNRFEFLEKQKNTHYELYEKIMLAANRNVYLPDHFIIGILKRSLDLVDSITILINKWHYIVSATLLRLQIDNLLRIFYSTKRNDKEFYLEFYSGKSFREIKHLNGKKLYDSLLIEVAKPIYPWIENIYKETSKLIHLSNKHFMTTIVSMDSENHSMETLFGPGQPNGKEENFDNLLDAFCCVSDAILKIVIGYIISKDNIYQNTSNKESK